MRIAVVGGGPAGSTVARRLALRGHDVTLFDPSHPREKPCGGGFGVRGAEKLPALVHQCLPKVRVRSAELRSPSGRSVTLPLSAPLYIASRRELDRALLERAVEAGARWKKEEVVSFRPGPNPSVRLFSGDEESFDFVVGADGVRSVVARGAGVTATRDDLTHTLGYFFPGRFGDELIVQFLPRGNGYLWAFPRPDHVSLGVACDLGSRRSRDLWADLHRFAREVYGRIDLGGAPRFSALIPSPRERKLARLQAEGPGWALCGDALAAVDPITREGITTAIETAVGLCDGLESPGEYTRFLHRALLPDLRRAARWKPGFFRPRFTELMVEYAGRSEAIRSILADLVTGNSSYRRLRRRLLTSAFPLALDYLFRELRDRNRAPRAELDASG